ncbi:hypothetical protein [Saccharopolyspora spinosa]|uniref:Uncharacterized protein n=1 Tax=Saccharopolyspora spinosa TaxID=60894 RepID=A0A2N3XZA3_SACSN|nr:hypothetical protein [Saccharopolyspora spinosa]PKW15959.1 hypothetical protein A8926_3741 [Saccharopolyspora spinosa]
MSLTDHANRAAVLHLMAEAFSSAAKHEKTATLAEMASRGTLHPTLPDGTEIAAVTVPRSATKVVVTDERALAAWVAERYPTEVETVPVVRPAFLERLKDVSKAAGEPCAPDGTLDVPGLEVVTAPPSAARVTPTEHGRRLAEQVVMQAQHNAVGYLAGHEIAGGGS